MQELSDYIEANFLEPVSLLHSGILAIGCSGTLELSTSSCLVNTMVNSCHHPVMYADKQVMI